MSWTYRALTALVAVLVLGVVTWSLWPKPVGIDVATISRGTLEVSVEDEGITRIRDVYTVSAPTFGKMLRAPHKVGDDVIAGKTVIAVLEPADPQILDVRTRRVNEAAVEAAEAAADLAEAQVKQARSQLTFAQEDLRRAMELSTHQTISARALDKAKLDAQTAEAALATALATLDMKRHELESARARLVQTQDSADKSSCCVEIKAPVTGKILKLIAQSEQTVQPGNPLVDIGNPENLEVAADLLSRDAVRVKAGADATIENWGGDPLTAKVRLIEPAGFTKVSALGIEEQRVRVILDFTGPKDRWQRLGHGFRIVARIVISRAENVPMVPLGALFRDGDRWAVFVNANGRASLRTIEIGERNARYARIVSGLTDGERVILYPSDLIHDGVSVVER